MFKKFINKSFKFDSVIAPQEEIETLDVKLNGKPKSKNHKYLSKIKKQQTLIKKYKNLLDELDKEKNKLSNSLLIQEKKLKMQDKKLSSNEEELTGYLNKIFEQQEKERIVKLIVNTVRESLEIDDVIKTTVEAVGKLLNVDRCIMALYEEKTNTFVLKNEYRNNSDISSVINDYPKFTICNDWFEKFIKKNEPIIVDDVESLGGLSKNTCFNNTQAKSYAIMPIMHKGETMGAIIVHQVKHQKDWKEFHIELLKYISSQISIAIRQAQLYSDIKRQSIRENLLRTIITTIRSTLEIDKVMAIICAEVAKIFMVDRVVITQMNALNKEHKVRKEFYVNEPISESLLVHYKDNKIGQYWWNEYFKNNKKVIIDNIDEYPIPQSVSFYYRSMNIKSLLGMSIKKGDNIWGNLFLSTQSEFKSWTEEDIELLETISDQIYIAIRQADLFSETKKSNKLKSEFLASMSHEFRTPLNAIIGFSDMMLINNNNSNLTEKQFDYLKNISVSGKHLLRLINDLLDLSKIESGNMEIAYECFNQKHVIYEIVSAIESVAKKKNIKINLDISDVTISADSRKFRQILYNLLSNAIKFTEDNGKITVASFANENNLRVEVIDTGIGIADENRKKLFVQFNQLDSSYTRKQEGTGLGLALTKKLVELHNGVIDFESKEGKGSKFWFELPLGETKRAKPLKSAES